MIKKIYIIAGEASGDKNAAGALKELLKIHPSIQLFGIGGYELRSLGLNALYDISDVSYIGFTSVIKNLKTINNILNNTIDNIIDIDPDILVLVDFPGFNLKIAQKIRSRFKGKIIYYISPQLWAWHESRVKIVKANIDKMIVIFPFEVEFYSKHGIKAEFAGHPMYELIQHYKKDFYRNSDNFITILPGSRREEFDRIFPIIKEASQKLSKEFELKVKLICSENIPREHYSKVLEGTQIEPVFNTNQFETYNIIYNSKFVISKVGTSSFECGLLGVPFCTVYKAGKLNYLIGKRLVKIDMFAMINILAGKKLVKEFIQDDMNVNNIVNEGKKLIGDISYRESFLNSLKQIDMLFEGHNASKNTAEILSKFLTESPEIHN
ncbi:lipid-A-disaccharide synthase [soil metagenome]